MNSWHLLFLALASLWGCQPAANKEISLGQPIRHDDFIYSAEQVVVYDSLGALKPEGKFWIITFRVDNEAKRVEHHWDNNTAFIVDYKGNVYENSLTAQQQLDNLHPFGWKAHYTTLAGRIDSTQLVFDLPRSVKQPYLKVRGDLLMGDVFDGRQFEHTKVKLFSP
ncbi:hypothetical protein WBJ53_05085 [Spirosoma sp. SC4-14]|uniref:hypothetical protein n=1 Tax=Spirosoma sp. SC4-14 TaxID=3128900 RepID=UPI0030CB2F96